jgi:hypothetical protein
MNMSNPQLVVIGHSELINLIKVNAFKNQTFNFNPLIYLFQDCIYLHLLLV